MINVTLILLSDVVVPCIIAEVKGERAAKLIRDRVCNRSKNYKHTNKHDYYDPDFRLIKKGHKEKGVHICNYVEE